MRKFLIISKFNLIHPPSKRKLGGITAYIPGCILVQALTVKAPKCFWASVSFLVKCSNKTHLKDFSEDLIQDKVPKILCVMGGTLYLLSKCYFLSHRSCPTAHPMLKIRNGWSFPGSKPCSCFLLSLICFHTLYNCINSKILIDE